MPGSDCALALRLAAEHGVPQGQRFQLLCRIRAARSAATAEGRYVHTKRRLLAVFSLLHLLASEHERLEAMLLVSDPELLPDLVALVGGAAAPRPALRTLALKCLSTAVRSRFMTAIEVMTKPQHRRLVPHLLHGAVAALLADAQQAGHLLAPPQGVTLPPPPVTALPPGPRAGVAGSTGCGGLCHPGGRRAWGGARGGRIDLEGAKQVGAHRGGIRRLN